MPITISKSGSKTKRFVAVFTGARKATIHFGAKGGTTFIDHGDRAKQKAYLARHGAGREDWANPYSAGSLSRWILWSKPDMDVAVADFRRRFKL